MPLQHIIAAFLGESITKALQIVFSGDAGTKRGGVHARPLRPGLTPTGIPLRGAPTSLKSLNSGVQQRGSIAC